MRHPEFIFLLGINFQRFRSKQAACRNRQQKINICWVSKVSLFDASAGRGA